MGSENLAADRSRQILRLEPLEPRLLLSGNVAVTLSGSTFTMVGDDLDNHVDVKVSGGFLGFVSGDGVTAVNGGLSAWFGLAEPTALRIEMAGGTDQVDLEGVTVSGLVTFEGGDGDDQLHITGSTMEALSVNNGPGSSVVEVHDTDIGSAKVQTLQGKTLVQIDTGSTVAGALSIRNGPGADAFQLEDSTVGSLRIANGEGATDTQITDSTVHGSVSLRDGKVYEYDDAFAIGGSTIEGSLKLNPGRGPLDAALEDSTVVGGVQVKALNGTHTVTIDGVEVGKSVKLTFGPGACSLDVGEFVHLSGNFSFEATGGQVAVAFDGCDLGGSLRINAPLESAAYACAVSLVDMKVEGGLQIKTGMGWDPISVSRLEVHGATSIITGLGDDDLTLADSLFAASVKMDFGGGSDELEIETAGLTGVVTVFNAPLSINMGDGMDRVEIGVTAQPGHRLMTEDSAKLDGGDDFDNQDVYNWTQAVPAQIVNFEA